MMFTDKAVWRQVMHDNDWIAPVLGISIIVLWLASAIAFGSLIAKFIVEPMLGVSWAVWIGIASALIYIIVTLAGYLYHEANAKLVQRAKEKIMSQPRNPDASESPW